MNAQPNAYKHAAKAALRMWQKRDQVIETGIDAHAMDHAMIDEMEQAAIMLRQLSERLYEAWQKRGGQSNDSGSFTVPAECQHIGKRQDRTIYPNHYMGQDWVNPITESTCLECGAIVAER